MKIETAIKQANIILKKNQIKSSLIDCEILISKAIDKNREFVILNLKNKIRDHEYINFKRLVNERKRGKPIAYLTGKKYFWKYEFDVNENVLIPRPDTEILIDQVLKIYKNKSKINFLDIGVGSGSILLSILKEKCEFIGTGIDVSNGSLNICKQNACKFNVNKRIKLYKSDIDNFNLGKYDLIVSNPPYIKKLDLKKLNKEVRDFEPTLALDGGLDGLSEIRKIIYKAPDLIKKNGRLIIEIAFNQKEEVKKILLDNGFFVEMTIKDLAKNNRCIISKKI
jgi:release factor glutamine methyltransferase